MKTIIWLMKIIFDEFFGKQDSGSIPRWDKI
jgi:hypothetical protein